VARNRSFGRRLTRHGSGSSPDSDGSELFADVAFWGHFEDAEVRSCLLRELIGARAAAGFTQATVAKAMETTQSAVSQLEGGSTDPRLSTLQRYARAVGAHLLVRLNLFSAITQDPTQWPALKSPAPLSPPDGITAFPAGNWYEMMHLDGILTERRDVVVP
jgi:transcriptional regulator with XRE-family HTH domain